MKNGISLTMTTGRILQVEIADASPLEYAQKIIADESDFVHLFNGGKVVGTVNKKHIVAIDYKERKK